MNFKPIIFSSNKLLNRLLIILIFFISLLISTSFILFNRDSRKNDLIKLLITIYISILNKFNYPLLKGETLFNFSNRISLDLPKISPQLIEISNLYNKYRFSKKNSLNENLNIIISLVNLKIQVFIYIAIKSNNKTSKT